MTHLRDDIEESYRFCRRMSRRAGSNFHAGFLLLPCEKRRAMEALYAFMRHTDDLADTTMPRPAVSPTDPRRDALTSWRIALKQALRGEPQAEGARRKSNGVDMPLQHSEVNVQHSILPALDDAVQRFHIPHEHLYAVIDGVEMDLDRRRYETFDQLQQYCQRVASAVGLACIYIWGFRGPEALEPARQAGIAFQLTNILRDLKEDALADRVYLPLADLEQCGYSVDNLLAGIADARFHRLMALEVARAERFYAEGAALMDWLSPSGRRVFGLMMATYRSLLRKIALSPADVLQRRLRLGSLKRIQLVARWSLLPPRKTAL